MNLGYACICLTLMESKPRVTITRTMIKKTLLEKGATYAGDLGVLNAKDLLKILKWNVDNNIKLFRLSSEFFPWASEYNIEELPQYPLLQKLLKEAGDYATANGIRIGCHPGPFNVLVSPNKRVVERTITDLAIHAKIFDMMGLSQTPYNKINIHCNGVYGDKQSAMDRFIYNFGRLSKSTQSRLTLENDDKASMYSVKDLMYIYERTGVPIVFDYHHHQFCTGGLSEEEALKLAASTWPKGIKPVVHYSESRALHENDPTIKLQAHSTYINSIPDTYGVDVDIMVEAKGKELAILPFINEQATIQSL